MQLKCQSENCCGNLILAKDSIAVKTEIGFTKSIQYFICEKCHKKYIPCPDCVGDGFVETILEDYADCETCNGSGVVPI